MTQAAKTAAQLVSDLRTASELVERVQDGFREQKVEQSQRLTR
jgi:hypothetical protein